MHCGLIFAKKSTIPTRKTIESNNIISKKCYKHLISTTWAALIMCAQVSPALAQSKDSNDRTGATEIITAGIDENTLLRYQLTPFDQINISIYNQPDLSSKQHLSEAGTIGLPLVGELKISGLTTYQAQKKIAQAFIDQEYLVNPIVTLNVESFSPKTVTVLGEVSSPGQVSLPDGVQSMEIQRLIAMVGDFSDIAKKNNVRIERRVTGQSTPQVLFIDVESIIESSVANAKGETFMIRPGDIIFVPRRIF